MSGEMTDDQLDMDARVEASYLTKRDRVVREWALGVAKRHRDRHWCWGVADGAAGQFMFGGPVISRDCDARNAALSLIGRLAALEGGDAVTISCHNRLRR